MKQPSAVVALEPDTRVARQRFRAGTKVDGPFEPSMLPTAEMTSRRTKDFSRAAFAFTLLTLVAHAADAAEGSADEPTSPPAPAPAPAPPWPTPAASPAPLAVVTVPSAANVEPTTQEATRKRHRLEWDPRWHRFRLAEYLATAATGVAAIGVFEFMGPSDHPKFVGPVLFDEPVRNALRLRTREGLQDAANISGYAAMLTPIQSLFDSLVLPTAAGNLDLAWQLGLMDAEAYSLSGLVTASLYDATGRARPDYADCKAGTSVNPLCNAGPYASFPSGHTAVAMTGAGLMCAHHGELPLYGGGAADVAACVEGLAVATGVGVLRMMADRHYASDVLTGGAIGFFSGYALPRLLHYWKRPLNEVAHRGDFKAAVVLGNGTTPFGARIYGIF